MADDHPAGRRKSIGVPKTVVIAKKALESQIYMFLHVKTQKGYILASLISTSHFSTIMPLLQCLVDGEALEGKLSLAPGPNCSFKVGAVLVSGCAPGALVDATAVHCCFLGDSESTATALSNKFLCPLGGLGLRGFHPDPSPPSPCRYEGLGKREAARPYKSRAHHCIFENSSA